MAYTTINDPTDYFNTVLYTGNGTAQSITGVGFKPDWVWIKDRDNGNSHRLLDSVRGVHKKLFSNSNTAEVTDVNSLTSFTADGFDSGSDSGMNGNTNSYVSWNWLASNTTASNTDGSITSTVSANTTSGFSIVSWTGTGSAATIGHGLGAVPTMIIVKNRDQTGDDWYCYNVHNGNTHSILLNSSGAKVGAYTDNWNNTTPTSSVFSVGGSHSTSGGSGEKMIAYCFTDIKGYSKFGSYTGNGNADGPFIYTGFKPTWVMFKPDTSADWTIVDNKRNTYNPVADRTLNANLSSAEHDGSMDTDFVSNGFKIRNANTDNNHSGTIIYMAFAESPFTTSTGVPTTAR